MSVPAPCLAPALAEGAGVVLWLHTVLAVAADSSPAARNHADDVDHKAAVVQKVGEAAAHPILVQGQGDTAAAVDWIVGP